LSKSELAEDFDGVIVVTAREKRLRASLLQLIAPQGEEAIVDIGSGTGTVAISIKASSANAEIEFVTAMGDDEITEVFAGNAGKVVSTSVLHQCPGDMKLAILANAYRLLNPGGSCSSRTMASSGIF
jgi:precorrin-6B methylase 2